MIKLGGLYICKKSRTLLIYPSVQDLDEARFSVLRPHDWRNGGSNKSGAEYVARYWTERLGVQVESTTPQIFFMVLEAGPYNEEMSLCKILTADKKVGWVSPIFENLIEVKV